MRVGILGGGQLGMMVAESLLDLGVEVAVYDPDPNAPARRLANFHVGAWTDREKLRAFIASVDVITYEFENVDGALFKELLKATPLLPSLAVLETCQHRAREKDFLRQHQFPHVDFEVAIDWADVETKLETFGLPAIVKSAQGGYDGHHQYKIQSLSELAALRSQVQASTAFNQTWVLERVIDLWAEASAIVAAGQQGNPVVFPIFENAHRDHILDFTRLPAAFSSAVQESLKELANQVCKTLGVVGLLTVEFFLSKTPCPKSQGLCVDNTWIYINELAPRPHNSGHITRQACTFSQFDALARIVTNQPLPAPTMRTQQGYCMANLLGDVWLAQGKPELNLQPWQHHPEILEITLYGKKEARARRKMGHLIAHASTASEALRSADNFRNALSKPQT